MTQVFVVVVAAAVDADLLDFLSSPPILSLAITHTHSPEQRYIDLVSYYLIRT